MMNRAGEVFLPGPFSFDSCEGCSFPFPIKLMNPRFFLFASVLLISTAAAQSPAPNASATREQGVILQASDLLPAELLRGPCHRVRDQVVTDGFMAHFEIDSDFGLFETTGVVQTKQRLVEIEAIRKLVETSKGDLFAEGMKRSITQPIEAVKNIVANPVDSLKQAPKTVGHFFGKVGASIERGVKQVDERIKNSGANDSGTVAREAGRGIGTIAKNAAGFDKAKLDTARQLGVDPYSDNPRLQEEMDKVTWAFFAGGLPLRIGASVASAGLAVAATNMVGIPGDTYDLTQSELALRDERSLAAMGVTKEDITAFQISRALSTTRRHRIVSLLEAMPKTAGRGHMIRLANSCEDGDQADFLISAIAILAERQRSGAVEYASIKVVARLPGAITRTGELEVPAPVDYVTWTEQVAAFAQRDDLGTGPKVLVHTGAFSQKTTTAITEAGWKHVAIAYPLR